MVDGRFAGDGTAADCAGDRRQRLVASGKATDPDAESGNPGFKTRFSAAKSGDPASNPVSSRGFPGKSDTFARLSPERGNFQALRFSTTGRMNVDARSGAGSRRQRGGARQ